MRENETNSLKKTKTLVGMAIFTAIVVVLQLIASFVKFGFFTPSLVLIPIVIGTAIYGIKAGAWLGFVFGVVVLIACITGADGGGYLMWGVNPAVTALICVGKGVACGALAGLTYQLLHHKNQILATVAAAVVCPVVNTGLFCLGAVAVFKPLLLEWAAGWAAQNGMEAVSLVTYVFLGLIGINFLVELLINVVLSPVVVRILKARMH
ncbi:MAG TPA: ECF transporter S component [Candidatus Avoscillospira stercoripullorum]|uniref:ECF transporter S component n=1 Tax=Candidatus Avoscillospira stercoripullorum TaxID=2840709 RepID=A0A9D1D6H9_9FIRM|nr:ECF transporter S component [Candidatus Avoscillospira stercoripullorum]